MGVQVGWKGLHDLTALDRYTLFIAIFGKAFLVLQIIKIISDRSSDNVSFMAYLLYFVTSISWVLYGVYYEETMITTSAFLGTTLSLLALVVILLYREKKTDIW